MAAIQLFTTTITIAKIAKTSAGTGRSILLSLAVISKICLVIGGLRHFSCHFCKVFVFALLAVTNKMYIVVGSLRNVSCHFCTVFVFALLVFTSKVWIVAGVFC